MILLSHPTGNQNARQAALALGEAGALHRFVTAAHFDSHSALVRLAPARVRAELHRRDFSDVAEPGRIASAARLREVLRAVTARTGSPWLSRHETGWASVDRVYHAVDAAVARRIERGAAVEAVYAYEDGALESFRVAKARGIRRIYELPIGYWRTHRRLCEEEARLHPEWAHTWHASLDSDAKVARKDAELALASHVIVPSRFVAESLRDYPGTLPPVSVIPYGCQEPIAPDARRWYAGGPLKLLFVGGLSQRKGLAYLLEALAPLGDSVALTVIGSGAGKELLGTRHRLLGSVPHAVVIQEMRDHDVFVFPTLFEGYSLAVAEALSQGLAVITTPNSGAADLIRDGIEGWIAPIRNSAAITQCLQQCTETPARVSAMGRAALKLASSWTWKRYREFLKESILNASSTLSGRGDK